MSKKFILKFLGVRGTIPRADKEFLIYGGNTSCVELICGDRLIILDAGSGIYNLSNPDSYQECDILLSHTHIDHIQGLPLFPLCYKKNAQVRLWAGHLKPENNLQDSLLNIFSPPIFPLNMNKMKAKISCHDFIAGEKLSDNHCFSRNEININTLPLNHPDKATAYRIEYNGKSVCYVTDIEHVDDILDDDLIKFVYNSDILIYDTTFTDENIHSYKGWGHSTWQQALRISKSANVKRLACFHHDPNANDETLKEREKLLVKEMPEAFIAKEGSIISL